VSDPTGAKPNKGTARTAGRGGGTSESNGKRSTAGAANSARDEATPEFPEFPEDTPQAAAQPNAPKDTDPVAAEGAAPDRPPAADQDAERARGIPWSPGEPPAAGGPAQQPPPPPPPPPSFTSSAQSSGPAVNRPPSPYGPVYGPSEVSAAGPPPAAPPHGTAPPPTRAPKIGAKGRVQRVQRARSGKRTAQGQAVGGRTPRKAHLQVSRFEPWSVMKFSFIMSLVCFVVLLVAVTVLYVILSGLGVFDAISSTVNDLTREQGAREGGLDATTWFSFARVFGYTALVGSLNVLLITALATIWAVIYNLAADFVGGVEVTLKEAE
jgi:hypothetical protein